MVITHTHCCFCRRAFSDINPLLKRTKDHFIPSSRSGNNLENILQCCLECNKWKADKMPLMWLNQVLYFQDKRKKFGTYVKVDYCQIIGSIRHWLKFLKDKSISDYNKM